METKRNYVLNFCCGLFAIILVITGIGVFATNIKAPAAAITLSECDLTKLEMLEYYYGEFCIVDAYSFSGDNAEDPDEYYCYALVNDKFGNMQAVSFSLDKNDTPFAAVHRYVNDPEAEVGSCVIKCYTKARRIKNMSSYLLGYFNEFTKEFGEVSGITVSIPTDLEYFCGPTASFDSLRRDQLRTPRIASAICTVIGGLLAVAAFLIPGIKTYSAVPKEEGPAQAENTAEDGTNNE